MALRSTHQRIGRASCTRRGSSTGHRCIARVNVRDARASSRMKASTASAPAAVIATDLGRPCWQMRISGGQCSFVCRLTGQYRSEPCRTGAAATTDTAGSAIGVRWIAAQRAGGRVHARKGVPKANDAKNSEDRENNAAPECGVSRSGRFHIRKLCRLHGCSNCPAIFYASIRPFNGNGTNAKPIFLNGF